MSTKIDFVKTFIEKCTRISDHSSAEKLVNDIISVFGKEIPGLTEGLDSYNDLHVWEGLNGKKVFIDYIDDVRLLKEKLSLYAASLSSESDSSQGPVINVNTNVTVNISMEQAFSNIEKTSLSDDDKDYLKEQIAILSTKKGNKDKLWKSTQSILKWLADKSVEVGIAALPYIVSLLE